MGRPSSYTRGRRSRDAVANHSPLDLTTEVAESLSDAFARIKLVDGVYRQEITRTEVPDLCVSGDMGVLGQPLGAKQAREMVEAALEGENNLYDTEAENLSAEPACVFREGNFFINNPRWEEYAKELAVTAAEGLGLDGTNVTAAVDSLWLWAKNCVWTTPFQSVRSDEDRRTWTGKMLIILPTIHEGGEITFNRNGHRESWSTNEYRQTMICWHKDMAHLEFKAPTRGHRLGLLYGLHVPQPLTFTRLRACHHTAVQSLQDAIERYAMLVRNKVITATAFFLPLKTKVPKNGSLRGGDTPVNKESLLPFDRAKVECFSEKGMDIIRGFKTHLALVMLTAREVMIFSRRGIGPETVQRNDTNYIIGDMVDTDGGDELGQPMRHLRDLKFEKDSVLDVNVFNSGLTRLVNNRDGSEETVFLKTILCLMLHFEEVM